MARRCTDPECEYSMSHTTYWCGRTQTHNDERERYRQEYHEMKTGPLAFLAGLQVRAERDNWSSQALGYLDGVIDEIEDWQQRLYGGDEEE